jgi:2-oxoglutarate ferredoxin oxidoreductase subunit delta
MARIYIDEDRCKGCELCTTACPKKIVVMSKDKINKKGFKPAMGIEMEKCIGCGFCAAMCPDLCIKVEK